MLKLKDQTGNDFYLFPAAVAAIQPHPTLLGKNRVWLIGHNEYFILECDIEQLLLEVKVSRNANR